MFNLRSLDLNLLTVFEAIYELGTVSAAANGLALSQSATSHALSRLRDACDDELFVRAGQGLIPTPTAQAMYSSIKQALEALRASLAEFLAYGQGAAKFPALIIGFKPGENQDSRTIQQALESAGLEAKAIEARWGAWALGGSK